MLTQTEEKKSINSVYNLCICNILNQISQTVCPRTKKNHIYHPIEYQRGYDGEYMLLRIKGVCGLARGLNFIFLIFVQ